MNVATILKHKGNDVASVAPDATLQETAALLSQKRIGAVLVLDQARKIQGIISERDIVRALSTHGAACLRMAVNSVMTSPVQTCRASDTIDQLMAQMTTGRFRHLPVVEDRQLVGIVSIGDVVKLRIAETELEVNAMRDYIAAH